MKNLAKIAAILAFSATPLAAHAADLYAPSFVPGAGLVAGDAWTGFYLGAGGGGAAVNHDLKGSLGTASAELDGIGGMGGFGTVQGGYDFRFGPSFVAGAFADYDFASVGSNASLTASGHTYKASATLTDSWTAGGRLGYLVNPATLVYGLGGYTQASFAMPAGVKGDFAGWTAGAGLEAHIMGGWSVKGEYRFTHLDGETLYNKGGLRITDQIDEQSGRALLVYKFGAGSVTGLK